MAQIKEILEIENHRADDCKTIYLFAEGLFYRAYEWSAWLCCRYVNEFKVTRREQKNETGSVVFIGFPIASLSKFVPDGVSIEQEEKRVILHLPAGNNYIDLEDTDVARASFSNWKNSIPMSSTTPKSTLRHELKNMTDGETPKRMSDIMFSIMAFPIEQKTPMECMFFLADLKQNIVRMM